MTTGWTLSADGDGFEQRHWGILRGTWPSYEVFWREFVVPLTGRPQDIKLRPGAGPLLEEMCMAHYSIFHHLVKAHLLLESLGQVWALPRTEEDIFFHMAAATEMIDRLLLAVWKIRQRVQRRAPPGALSADRLVQKATKYHPKGYASAYDRYLDTGRSVGIPLHNVRDLALELASAAAADDLAKDVWRIADDIRAYRNFLTHNPLVPKLVDRQGVVLLPKPEKLTAYDLWSSAFLSATAREDYTPASGIISDYLKRFEPCVDALWIQVIQLLRDLGATAAYAEMLPPRRQAHTETMQDSPTLSLGDLARDFTSTQASGTASAYEDMPDDPAENDAA